MVEGDIPGRWSGSGDDVRCDNGRGPLPRGRPLEPGEQFVGVADGGRQPDSLNGVSRELLQPFQYGEEVPPAVVACERVDLVHDDGLNVGEVLPRIDLGGHEHRFE